MKLDEWKFSLRVSWENPFLKWGGILILCLMAMASVYSGYQLTKSSLASGYVVTHYSVYLGIDQVVPNYWIAVLCLMPILVISGTILCAYALYRANGIATYGLMALSGTTTLIWIYYLYHLIKINF